VILAVAVDAAFPAGRFRLQRAIAPLLQGMLHYSRALPAKEGFLAGYFLESNI